MKRRLLVAAGMSALLMATAVPGAATAQDPERFGRVSTRGRTVHLDRLPSQQAKNRMVQVAVELDGRPVAAYQGAALAAGDKISESRKADIRRLLSRRQAAVRVQLRNLGADIEASYTDVFNGLRIRVRANRIDEISRLGGVKNVYRVPRHTRSNANTIAYLGADRTWAQTGLTGQGVNIAIIDSGINYYHHGFGGAGFNAWRADNGLSRGNDFPTAKVIAGFDLVGDDYDGDSNPIPEPDNDPLDCKAADAGTVQHGTHVAGTAAGFGVTNTGQKYTGAYTPAAIAGADLRIAPGVAPKAKLMAFRVFGCNGSTFVVVDAIEMAVRAGADIINMSLGSDFGNPGSLDALATNNASLAGVTVVISSGNAGPSAYVTGSPGSAIRAITVAAMDAQVEFPGATIDMASGGDISAINANDAGLPVTGKIRYFVDNPGTAGNDETGEGYEQSGCTPSSFAYNNFKNNEIAVVQRGFCARTFKAQQGQKANARAVIQVNNVNGLPPYENQIGKVTIPFIGVSMADDGRFETDDGETITIRNAGVIPNPVYGYNSDFTSAGPGKLQNLIKPDVSAPGVSTFSVDGSTVLQGKALSGTSMAAPAVAGVAALVKEAHPGWLPRAIKAAIVGTAAAGKINGYDIRLAGSGLAQPRRAVDTKAFVYTAPGSSSLTFGYQQAGNVAGTNVSFRESRKFTIVNTGNSAISYNLSNKLNTPSYGLVTTITPSAVTVPAHGQRLITVTVSLSKANAGDLPDSAPFHAAPLAVDAFGQLYTSLTTVAGVITAKPSGSGTGIYPLRVPWLVVPRGLSRLEDVPASRTDWVSNGDLRRSSIKVRNYGPHKGIADVFAWGLQDADEGLDGIDLRAAGVQSVNSQVCDSGAAPSDRCVIIAVNTWGRWSNASENEIDVLLDMNKDGTADYLVAAADLGLVIGALSGVTGSVIVDLNTGELVNIYLAGVSPNGSTLLLPALASDLGLRPNGLPGFWYWAEAFEVYDDDGTIFQFDVMTTGLSAGLGSQVAHFDAFDPVLNTGAFKTINAGGTKGIPLIVDSSRYHPKTRGQKGWMIVTLDDKNGEFQADLVPVGESLP